jgi:UDPglucose 6-dehydrogenase
MKVSVTGTGHVGLVTCVSLASIGHSVVGCDSDLEKISLLRGGVSPFYEPGLDECLREQISSGRLVFTSDREEAVRDAEVVFICVGTPARVNGEANLLAIENAARQFARHATGPGLIVEKSTVPAGTAGRIQRVLQLERPDLNGALQVVSNPEFLREGKALEDALQPDRILVGASSAQAFETMRRLYAPLIAKGCRLIETDIPTAELAKHACNAFLALKISYVNGLARLCERAGGDVLTIAEIMGADSRIGRDFLDAGLGYGGYCFPKDLQAFERLSARLGYEFGLLREVVRINEESIDAAVEKLRDALWNLEDKRIALLGLSFKPGTDDTRFSPALALGRRLLREGACIVGYDPQAGANAKEELPELEIAPGPYEAASGSHGVVLCTDWPEFRMLDLDRLRSVLAFPLVVDGRNLFEPSAMRAAGLAYYPTGRPPVELDGLAR